MSATHIYSGIAAWNTKLAAEIHSYEDAAKFLADDRPGARRKLAASMEVIRMNDTADGKACIGVRLYSTTILCYREDGKFWADNGGYNTVTTSSRLNMVAPRGWYFSHHRRQLVGNMGVPMRRGEWHPVDREGAVR